MNQNYIGLYPDKQKKKEEKNVASSSSLAKLETALTNDLEKKANVVTAPQATQAPTPEQKQEQKVLVKEPMLYQRNKLGDYPFQDQSNDASKAMMVQKLNDQSDLERIRKSNESLKMLSSQFGLNELSNRSYKKHQKKQYNKLASQTHM